MSMQHIYDQTFYDQIERGARSSARLAISILKNHFSIKSVLDIGAGRGGWLAEWISSGTDDVIGVDGAYVNRTELLIPQKAFIANDLTQTLTLHRQFDLVESLEVAEHLDSSLADGFVTMLVSYGSMILFSAATPGQGGEHHVNEQPLDYWRDKFRARGYHAYDLLRPILRDSPLVEPWYRYNMILYVREDRVTALPDAVAQTEIGPQKIADFRPVGYRLKSAFRSCLPAMVNTWWAMFKDRQRARMLVWRWPSRRPPTIC